MLYNLLSMGNAPRVELDNLLDKTTVQGLSASRGLSAVIHWYYGNKVVKPVDAKDKAYPFVLILLGCYTTAFVCVRT